MSKHSTELARLGFAAAALLLAALPAFGQGLTINQLGSASALTGTELFPIYQGANPAVTTTPAAIATYAMSQLPTYLASPPAIGGTAAAAGTFTNLKVTGTTTILNGSATAGLATVTSAGVVGSEANATIAQGGTGQSTAAAAFNALSPTTTEGDLIYYHGSSNARLAAGSQYQALVMGSSDPAWGALNLGQSAAVTGTLGVGNGGTGGSSASGTLLDNITGFSSTGFIERTGAGAYSFVSSTGSGNVVLATSPTLTTPIAAALYGGSSAGSTLTLQSTSAGSPSGDEILIKASSFKIESISGTDYIDYGFTGSYLTLNGPAATNGAITFQVSSSCNGCAVVYINAGTTTGSVAAFQLNGSASGGLYSQLYNTGSSTAFFSAATAGGHDAYFQASVNGGTNWSFGNHYSTGHLVLSAGSDLTTPEADLSTSGLFNAVGGFAVNGSAGLTQTCTVNQAHTLIFTLGILTGGTCNS